LKRRARNRQMRSRLRTMLKKVRAAIDARNVDTAAGLKEAFSLVDKMANKGIIHRNTAARYKSRLVKRLTRARAAA